MPKSESRAPRPPKGAGTAGSRLWRSITAGFELSEHELSLLRQAVHVADVCEDLQAVVEADGPLSANRFGETKAHPALVELRAQRLLLARLVVALRVPLGDQEDGSGTGQGQGRLQRRGIRGVYTGGAA